MINRIAFALFLVFCFCACSKTNQEAKPLPESVFSYVYAYTSGTISRTAPIKIRFAKDAVTSDKEGTEADQKLLSFTPKIAGTLIWEDQRTLRFDPAEYLSTNTPYLGQMQLKSVFPDAPNDAQSFEFDFRTRELNYTLKKSGFSAKSITNLADQTYQGSISTTDYADAEQVEKIISAQQNGNDLSVIWQHDGTGTQHDFTVENIKRTEEVGEFKLAWTGSPIGSDYADEEAIEIPALNDFKIMSAQVNGGEEQFIRLNFSDPLKKNQNLNGLIRVTGYSGKLRFLIEGNQVLVYPAGRLKGKKDVVVDTGIRNIADKKMKSLSSWNLTFEEEKPQVRLVGKGAILPTSDGLLFPFEAINLESVEVEIFKIFNNNILQFLQNSDLDASRGYDMKRVGRIIAQEKISLKELSQNPNQTTWVRYALDLSRMIEEDPTAIYQVRIGFKHGYSAYFCESKNEKADNLTTAAEFSFEEEGFTSIMDSYYGVGGYYSGYSYKDRDNPCKKAYYNNDRFVSRNILASDLGIITKKGKDKSWFTAVSNLKTTDPVVGARLEFYDYQQQLIKTVETDSDGMSYTELERTPAFIVAKFQEQKGYVKTSDGSALSLSKFDVSGAVTQKGMKGYIYGERGVWRPGDSLFLNFILEDKNQVLPPGHPINFTLYDAKGQVYENRTVYENVDGIFALYTETKPDDATGNWRAEVKVGGATFSKTLKIETIKPNRLKARLSFAKKELSSGDMPAAVNLQANWLHGAPARNLKAKVEMQISQLGLNFKKYKEYRFSDPTRRFSSRNREVQVVFDGLVDASGAASFTTPIYQNKYAPGKIKANFKTRVFEKGGDFSTSNTSVIYHPYNKYAGISLPKNRWGSNEIDVNKTGRIKLVTTDKNGTPIANEKLKIGIYRASWRWWWDSGRDNVAAFNSSSHANAEIKADLISDSQGLATYDFTPKKWGRYLVRVCNEESGHCSGSYLYSGNPWYDDENNAKREGATMLAFAADKKKYKVGETVEITVPANDVSQVLITLETGSKVIKSFRRAATKGENTFSFQTTEEMAPTVYAHVSLIQPHAQTVNDLPIRMYGVIPIKVENPKTILEPEIALPAELKPEETFTVKVNEKLGKAMAYTLAVVDEGLLDLTNFKTPDPHGAFYAREALGVKTFDIYDQVIGAYGGDLSRVLSIGGDAETDGEGNNNKQANRFKPVVRHIGPFYLEKGKTAKHQITMPNYVGSVRVMAVAANKNAAYGRTEKTVPVRKPLMVLATLPRVLGPGETLRLPISVFAMDNKIKNAQISVSESSGLVGIGNEGKQSLNFSEIGDKIAYFDLKVSENTGIARFDIRAEGAGESASQQIEIQVRNPNPVLTNVESTILQAGTDWETTITGFGTQGTNEALIEVSNLPPLDLGRRMRYLVGYPYGCLEQTTSKAFPQLYINRLLELPEEQKQEIPENIQAALDKFSKFRLASGNLAYWAGNSRINHWTNNYAGHFMLEAEKLGYSVPVGLKKQYLKAQTKLANTYDPRQDKAGFYRRGAQEIQAYRLYVLSLANQPALGAMNRLREMDKLSSLSRWQLAAAYVLAGKTEVAKQLTASLDSKVEEYRDIGGTFGSALRDKAIILETLNLLGEKDRATEILKEISDQLSSRRWLSTQEIAYSLLAIGKFVGDSDISSDFKFAYALGSEPQVNTGSNNPLINIPIAITAKEMKKVKVKNTSNGVLFARVISTGQPTAGKETAAENKLKLSVTYRDNNKKKIDPAAISQGTDFIAEVKITHPGSAYKNRYDGLALDQIFPSGWEILNTRMDNLTTNDKNSYFDFQDVRDDRVYTFFDLNYGQTATFTVRLNAAYQGKYYLPAQNCSAMYDESINARQAGTWVEVTSPETL